MRNHWIVLFKNDPTLSRVSKSDKNSKGDIKNLDKSAGLLGHHSNSSRRLKKEGRKKSICYL
jgi:hypothetical protein